MTSGHPSFDHTVQDANLWLKAIATQLHLEERRHAYSALRSVSHGLRDRLQTQTAVNFGAQLPMVIRGLYYEGWHCDDKPSDDHAVDEFCATVRRNCRPIFRWMRALFPVACFKSCSIDSIPERRRK